ncbi:AAA family ATPase [Anabaena aphanizomenioides LEGE 00250]|uniref:AAA family ATPase n=1 Tax=Sphaerospermopsis aphanizomenoides LEGE 00250 TaxID=2777972 RepID=A0ABR9VDU0_9CYAN|nr:AAA family ATPase [Sphaerospermopsis aphanizomenoides]MBE9236638.1 AAA family ATPase [Sphaerospermopsis aphanizomenoides LEGE 00250]
MPAKVVSLINLKGGVAKTTTTVQLAECLASQFGKNVLVIDLDPQTNATIALIGEDKWDELDRKKQTVFQMFQDKLCDTSYFQVQQAIQKGVSNLNLKTLSLLPSSIQLIDIQDKLKDIAEKTEIFPVEVLKHFIKPYLNNYDYVLIDCPPNLGNITKNGIEISDYFLIPTIPDKLSIYGVPQIIKSIHTFAGIRHLNIKCLGLVITQKC